MANYPGRLADGTKILMKREMAAVLVDLRHKVLRSKNARLNLVVFRLAACCGLRASEIAHLQMADVRIELPRPHLRIRASAAKGGRPRMVPLRWDRGTTMISWLGGTIESHAVPRLAIVSSVLGKRTEAKLCFRVSRLGSGSAPPARCLARNDSRRSRFTTVGTRSSVMYWLADEHLPKCATQRGIRM